MKNKKIIPILIFLIFAAGLSESEAAVKNPSRAVVRKSRKPAHHGTAAWYSKKDRHIRRHTASGEVFDDSKLTCAAWDVPLGTHLKVMNLENKKEVICRVNDRGPAKHLNRKLDLSRAAFRKIANLHQGLIRVSVIPLRGRPFSKGAAA